MLAAAHETNLLCQLEAVLPTKQPSWRVSEPKLIPIVTTAEQVYAVSFAHFLPGLGVPCYYLPGRFN
jgi:hypothetical protein